MGFRQLTNRLLLAVVILLERLSRRHVLKLLCHQLILDPRLGIFDSVNSLHQRGLLLQCVRKLCSSERGGHLLVLHNGEGDLLANLLRDLHYLVFVHFMRQFLLHCDHQRLALGLLLFQVVKALALIR